jgi:TPR repeat protein/putative methionine-R-sulfoxide reductase with GAF domain
MVAINSILPSALPNRRRRVRHKIQTPAYASFTAESKGAMLDLHEIVDISEEGLSIQCHTPLEVEKQVNLCLDLAECPEHIFTTGQVIWSNPSGRAGLRLTELPPESLSRLREWLFVNVMAGVANGEAEIAAFTGSRNAGPPRPGYTDTLEAVTAIRRQVEALGSNLDAALHLIAERAQVLVRASGVAIALADDDPNFMVCHACSGADAPPVGARLQVGHGFSGECVQSGKLLRCDDTELDARVDRESCRALGIRSILAAPVRAAGKSSGLIEAFSAQPEVFSDADGTVLQRLGEIVLKAANRASRTEPPSPSPPEAPLSASHAAGSAETKVSDHNKVNDEAQPNDKNASGISLPSSHLIILVCAAATIMFSLGWGLAPWLQSDLAPWVDNKLHAHGQSQLPTVLASSQPPKSDNPVSSNPAIETATLEQLRQLVGKGDAVAQNALGLRYATGNGVKLSEEEAVRWFTKAAEQGYVPAQSKLGSIYYSGRGVPQDPNRAYFWMVLARLSGDEASKTLAPMVRARLTRAQVTSIEFDADRWLQQNRGKSKPAAGQLKARN